MHDVIIAGAGPVGLSLALGLARQGVRSIVLEQEAAIPDQSRAPVLLPRSLEIFKQWQVLDAVRDAGRWQSEVRVWMAGERRPRAGVDFTVLDDLTGTAGLVILPQNRLQAVIKDCLGDAAEVRFGWRVEKFVPIPGGVRAHVTGPEGETTVEGRYLIGCDGAHSAVRRTLGWELEGKTYAQKVRLADLEVPDSEDLPGPRTCNAPFLLFAVRLLGTTWRLVSAVPRHEPDDQPLDPAILHELFEGRDARPIWSSVFNIHCRNSPFFRSGHVLLAGDAAHINSPAGGQGMNAGIADAHNLAWKLVAALRGGDEEALLQSYEEERRAVIMHQIDPLTDVITKVGLLANPSIRAVVGPLAGLAMAQRPVMRTALRRISMLDSHYPLSSVISGRGPLLGHRLDAPLAGGSRLIDYAPVLLLWDDGGLPAWPELSLPGVSVRRISAATSPPADLHDAQDVIGRQLTLGEAPAMLLRPDGHVGWMANRPTLAALRAGVARALGGVATTDPEYPEAPSQGSLRK